MRDVKFTCSQLCTCKNDYVINNCRHNSNDTIAIFWDMQSFQDLWQAREIPSYSNSSKNSANISNWSKTQVSMPRIFLCMTKPTERPPFQWLLSLTCTPLWFVRLLPFHYSLNIASLCSLVGIIWNTIAFDSWPKAWNPENTELVGIGFWARAK